MERIELELLTDERVSYRYYPEFRDDFGIVSLMRKTDKVIHDKVYPDVTTMYVRQAVYRMRQYNKAGEFPEKATVMWY